MVKSSYVPIVSPNDPAVVCPNCTKEEYKKAKRKRGKLRFAGLCEECGSAAFYEY
ncbi:hypothetical protein [Methanopyrus sp.]